MRDTVPTQITGPVLIYERAKNGYESFYCAYCRLDFMTINPLEAFQLFSQHKCPSRHGTAS